MESDVAKFIELLTHDINIVDSGYAVSIRTADAAVAMLTEAEQKGAAFHVGGPSYQDKESARLQPSIITGVTSDRRLFDEESFSPSVSVFAVKDEEEAIKLVNASVYGLVAAVHTKDMYRGLQVVRRLEVGVAHINGMTTYDESEYPIHLQYVDYCF